MNETLLEKTNENLIKAPTGGRFRRDRGISYFAGILLGIVLAVVVYVALKPQAETGMKTATDTASKKLNDTLQ